MLPCGSLQNQYTIIVCGSYLNFKDNDLTGRKITLLSGPSPYFQSGHKPPDYNIIALTAVKEKGMHGTYSITPNNQLTVLDSTYK